MINIMERYKQIEGYQHYYITEAGDVYSYRDNKTGWQGQRKLSPKGKNKTNRYLQVVLSKGKTKKYAQIHVLVAKAFCAGYRDGLVVNHIDGNIHNNHYLNLEWVTQKENIHISYESSGKNQVRNYYDYNFISPDGSVIGVFRGIPAIIRFAQEHNIAISPSGLKRNGISKGYKAIKRGTSKTVTTIERVSDTYKISESN